MTWPVTCEAPSEHRKRDDYDLLRPRTNGRAGPPTTSPLQRWAEPPLSDRSGVCGRARASDGVHSNSLRGKLQCCGLREAGYAVLALATLLTVLAAPTRPTAEPLFTIAPPPRFSISGISYFMQRLRHARQVSSHDAGANLLRSFR